jgi:hypothetical protein
MRHARFSRYGGNPPEGVQMSSIHVAKATVSAGGGSLKALDVEQFRDGLRRLLRHVTGLIDDKSMSPCVRWSLGNLAVVAGLPEEVYPSAIARAVQMAEASARAER